MARWLCVSSTDMIKPYHTIAGSWTLSRQDTMIQKLYTNLPQPHIAQLAFYYTNTDKVIHFVTRLP